MIGAHDGQPDEDLAALRASLQRLAHTGSDQQPLFPEATADAGALASEFDRCARPLLGDRAATLSPEVLDAVAAVSGKLTTMSRDGADFDADLWTDAALRSSEHWAEVRRLAFAALDVLTR